jgi:hypothetical protein
MFGHQDDRQDDNNHDEHGAAAVQEVAPDHAQDQGQQDHSAPADDSSAADDNASPDDSTPQGTGDDGAWQHPGEPVDDSPGPISDIVAPVGGHNPNPVPAMPSPSHHGLSDDDAKVPHELIDIKQKALGSLTPLIDKLDQTPEEKFRTTMMMIQASDDQSLVKAAYDAANSIEDEKVRAQALLDVVNEINYFTQHPKPDSQ